MKLVRSKAVSGVLAVGLIGLLNTGCATRQYSSPQEAAANACSAMGPKALSGALIGGLGGAAAGAGIGAAAGGGRGAAIGAGLGLAAGIIGGLAVGNRLDQNDCAQAQIALAQAAEAAPGQAISWRSPTGSYGSYTPSAPIYADASTPGRVCRQFSETVVIKGHEPVQDTGTTCRDGDGDWHRI
jgi:surface antigen